MQELAIFIGLQASGKTTFYRKHMTTTHVHVSKDLWPNARKRQNRQLRIIETALAMGKSVAVDNTNPSPHEWGPLIELAKSFHVRVVAYWFPPEVQASLDRNATREGKSKVPEIGIFATAKKLQQPRKSDRFDEVYVVKFDNAGDFIVTPQKSKVKFK